MSTYCNLADMITQVPGQTLIELSDDSGVAIIPDEGNVNAAISQAGDDIDGYLRGSYALPLTTIPSVVKNIAVDLAIYNLWTRRPERDVPDVILRKNLAAIAKLKDIQRGTFTLDIITPIGQSNINSFSGVTNKTGRKFFSERLLHEFGYSDPEYRSGHRF